MAERLPKSVAPKGAGPRPPRRASRETAPALDLSDKAKQRVFGTTRDETPCRYCHTTLRHPKFSPPPSCDAIPLPLTFEHALKKAEAACVCCAIERLDPVLIDFLDRGEILVLAWDNHSPAEVPSAGTLVRYCRLVYGYCALADAYQGGQPGYIPFSRDISQTLLASLRAYGLHTVPIWDAPAHVRVKVDAFIHDTEFSIPLPKAGTPLSLDNASPNEQSWLRTAWSRLVAERPDLWRQIRPHLSLIPSLYLAHNPLDDIASELRRATPPVLDDSFADFFLAAGLSAPTALGA